MPTTKRTGPRTALLHTSRWSIVILKVNIGSRLLIEKLALDTPSMLQSIRCILFSYRSLEMPSTLCDSINSHMVKRFRAPCMAMYVCAENVFLANLCIKPSKLLRYVFRWIIRKNHKEMKRLLVERVAKRVLA